MFEVSQDDDLIGVTSSKVKANAAPMQSDGCQGVGVMLNGKRGPVSVLIPGEPIKPREIGGGNMQLLEI